MACGSKSRYAMTTTQLTETTPFQVLRRTWQPVANAADLPPGQVRAVTLLGEELVLARFETGLLAAPVACPHKGMRLSLGCISDGALQCPYHGWRFGQEGACTAIPSLEAASVNKLTSASLQTFGVQERYGMIWVQLEPDASQTLPLIPEFESGDWTYLVGPPTPFAAGWRREVENFLDMTHFAFAHAATLGSAADTRVPPQQIAPTADGFSMRTEFPALNSLHEQPGKLSSAHARFYQTWLPNFTVIRQTWPDGDERLLLHVPSPLNQHDCVVFWALAVSPGFQGPAPTAQLDFAVRVLDEDRQMCENQIPREVPLNPTKGGWGVLVAPGDTLANTFQKSFRQWLTDRAR